MADPFYSSRRKLARAKYHLDNLDRLEMGFINEQPYSRITEPDPNRPDHTIHKLKAIKPLPPDFPDVIGDAAYNLRAVLDHACYALAVLHGKPEVKDAYFPFGRNEAGFENTLKGRCTFMRQEFHAIFRTLKPYPGGNDLLAALNAIRNADGHKIVTPMAAAAAQLGARATGQGFFSMPREPVWDRSKQEMELITLASDAKYKINFDFVFFIAFDEVEIVGGQQATAIIADLTGIVDRILMAIEAEARRLFPGSF